MDTEKIISVLVQMEDRLNYRFLSLENMIFDLSNKHNATYDQVADFSEFRTTVLEQLSTLLDG